MGYFTKSLILIVLSTFLSTLLFAQDEGKFNEGVEALRSQDFQKAVNIFGELSKKYPDNKEVRLNKAISNFYLGDLGTALNEFTAIIKDEPNNADAYNYRGLIHSYSANYEDAISDFNNAIKKDKDFAEAYINRGNIYIQINEFNRALSDYNTAEKYDKTNPMLYLQRGGIMHRMMKYSKAIEDYKTSLSLGFQDAKLYADMASSYFKLRNYEKAVEFYSKALQLDPNDLKSLNNRSVAYFEIGEKDKAEADKMLFNQKMAQKYKPVEEIEFVEYKDNNDNLSIEIPKDWHFHQVKATEDVAEFYITQNNFAADGTYSVGGMFYLVKNAASKFDVRDEQDLLLYWNNKRQEEANNFVSYGYIQKKQFPINGNPSELNVVKVQYNKGGPELAIYEFAVAYGNNLLIAYLQASIDEFEYYRQIFLKSINSIDYKFPTSY